MAIPLVEGSSSSTSTSKCHWTLLHRYLVVTWALSTHSPTSNDLRAFTQISQVASFLLSNRFLTAFGQCGGRGGKINIILILCLEARNIWVCVQPNSMQCINAIHLFNVSLKLNILKKFWRPTLQWSHNSLDVNSRRQCSHVMVLKNPAGMGGRPSDNMLTRHGFRWVWAFWGQDKWVRECSSFQPNPFCGR